MNTDILPRDGTILCAVSGGADSMYLLCVLCELGYRVAAAHYHHGLRGAEADRDLAFVQGFCDERGIPFLSERGNALRAAADRHMGVEEAARALRYDFLERAADSIGAAVIATAHTADDNAETVLFHLARGAGMKGLAGIPPVRGRIRRPLLDVTRDEVTAYLRKWDIPHMEDSSNGSDVYARNRLRHEVLPVLKSVNPAFVRAVGRSAALLRQDEIFLQQIAEQFVAEHGDGRSLSARALLAQPWSVASRAVRIMAGRELSAAHVDAVLQIARKGGAVDVPRLRIASAGGKIWFGAAQAAPIPETALCIPGCTAIPGTEWTFQCSLFTAVPKLVHSAFNIFCFSYEKICGSIAVGSFRPGDACRPQRRGCTKPVRRLLQEAGVPPWLRAGVPVLRDAAGVIGVAGVGVAERVFAGPDSRTILQIEMMRRTPDEGDSYA